MTTLSKPTRSTRSPLPAPKPIAAQSHSESIFRAAVIRLECVPPGAEFEAVSLTKDPAATFSSQRIMHLPITGYDLKTRTATVFLDSDLCSRFKLEPGDRLLLRQVNDGRASTPVHVHLDPAPMQRRAAKGPVILSLVDGTFGTLTQPRAVYNKRLASPAYDERAPIVRADRLSLVGVGNEVHLVLDAAVEPGVSVKVQNLRTSDVVRAKVAADQTRATVALPGCLAGDTLVLIVEDAAKNAATPVHLTYAPRAARGVQRTTALDLRLPSTTTR